MTLLTESGSGWPAHSPDAAARRATRLLLSCLAAVQVAMAAVSAVTLSGSRLSSAVGLELLAAAVVGGAILTTARAARSTDAADLPADDDGPLAGPSVDGSATSFADSALVPSGLRTGESFFDLTRTSVPARPGPSQVVLVAALLGSGMIPGLAALASSQPWAAGPSCLAVVVASVILRGRQLGVVCAVTGAVWVGVAAYSVAGVTLAAANGTTRGFGLSPALQVAGWSHAAIAVVATVCASGVIARHLSATREAMARATDAVQSRSVRDPLTGLSNRLGLEMVAGPMIENARRNGQAVHCLYLDVDDFRTLNEVAGLHVGDEVLIAVAEAVLGSIRGTDVGARWDGDEFVVVGPGTGTSPLELERRVRAQLAAFPPVPPVVWSGRVSIGSAMLVPWDDGDLDSLLRRADQDMTLRRSLRRQGRSRPGAAGGLTDGPSARPARRDLVEDPDPIIRADPATDQPVQTSVDTPEQTPSHPAAPEGDVLG